MQNTLFLQIKCPPATLLPTSKIVFQSTVQQSIILNNAYTLGYFSSVWASGDLSHAWKRNTTFQWIIFFKQLSSPPVRWYSNPPSNSEIYLILHTLWILLLASEHQEILLIQGSETNVFHGQYFLSQLCYPPVKWYSNPPSNTKSYLILHTL